MCPAELELPSAPLSADSQPPLLVRAGETSWEHPLDAHYKELAMSEKAKKAKAAAS